MTRYGRGYHLRGAPTIPPVATRHILLIKGGSIVLRSSLGRVRPRKESPRRERHSGIQRSTAILGGGPDRGTVEEGGGGARSAWPRLVEPVTARGNSRRKLGARPVKGPRRLFVHQESLIVMRAWGLDEDAVRLDTRGGALEAEP